MDSLRDRKREFVNEVLAEHERRRTDKGGLAAQNACCVFADALLELREEHEALSARTNELVGLVEYLIATDDSLDRSRSDLYKRACAVRELLPSNPKVQPC
jgi:hypothetical protein